MWDTPRLLNMAAGALVGVAALAFSVARSWLLMRSELFPVREIEVKTALQKTSKQEIQAAVADRIRGNFFAVSPAEVRAGLEKLPWVRSASVRRVWPDRLEGALEEPVALARWSELSGDPQRHALVSTLRARFLGRTDRMLPLFVWPPATHPEVAPPH